MVIFLLVLSLLSGCQKTFQREIENNTFSYNIPIAPQSFDPILQQGTNSRYLLNHLYLTLYKWDKDGKLQAYGADSCSWNKNVLKCHLKKGLQFQDGSLIKAQNYIFSLNLNKETQTKKTLDFNQVQYTALDDYTLEFKLLNSSKDLKHKLTLIELAPRKEQKLYKKPDSVISSTNFYIHNFKENQYITLKHKTKKYLSVKVYFIEDQSTALRLYEIGKLSLLTLLPVRELEKYEQSKDLFHIPMTRMDGIFFNDQININLKKKMFHSLNFQNLKSLYKSIGTPGCPALPKSLYKNDYCYKYDPQLQLSSNSENTIKTNKLKLSFSTTGGDDIQRGMEWFAHEWKKNLNLEIEIDPLESGVFYQKIKSKSFDIVRKGIPLDNPTCLEALSSFKSNDPNNVSGFKNRNFDKIVKELEKLEDTEILKTQELCDKALDILYKNYSFLPLGPMYFSYLQNGKFKGWSINSLNILDLENLDFN